jgi:hypothetical protein
MYVCMYACMKKHTHKQHIYSRAGQGSKYLGGAHLTGEYATWRWTRPRTREDRPLHEHLAPNEDDDSGEADARANSR